VLKLTPELIEHLDKLAPSPKELAAKVFNILKAQHSELTDYEISCFCVEFLGMMVLQEYEFLLAPVKTLSKDFYYSHYLRTYEHIWAQIGEQALTKEDTIKSGPSEISNASLQKND
jgi:hypothetical protein